MVSTEDVVFHKDGDIAVITLNRPAQRNAMSTASRRAFADCLSRVDEDTRVVVVRGAGANFCAGADLSDTPKDPIGWRDRILTAQRQHAQLINMKQVVISAVQGAAVGGGASLALAADVMLMATDAFLSFPFVKLGVVPDGGASFLLQAKLGSAVALDVLLSGGTLSASEAEARGLTRRVVAADQLEAKTMALAQELAALPSEALQLTKALCAQTWATQMASSFRHEADAFGLATATDSHHKAIAAAKARISQKKP